MQKHFPLLIIIYQLLQNTITKYLIKKNSNVKTRMFAYIIENKQKFN